MVTDKYGDFIVKVRETEVLSCLEAHNTAIEAALEVINEVSNSFNGLPTVNALPAMLEEVYVLILSLKAEMAVSRTTLDKIQGTLTVHSLKSYKTPREVRDGARRWYEPLTAPAPAPKPSKRTKKAT